VRKYFLIFLFCLLLVSCANSNSTESKRYWEYNYYNHDSIGAITYTFNNLRGVAYNFNGWANITPYEYGSSTNTLPFGIYRNYSDGLHRYSNVVGNNEALFLKHPAVLLETYPVYYGNPIDTFQMEVSSISDTLTLPYSFISGLYKYSMSLNGTTLYRFWYNPQLWIVKCEKMKQFYNGSGFYADQSYNLATYVDG